MGKLFLGVQETLQFPSLAILYWNVVKLFLIVNLKGSGDHNVTNNKQLITTHSLS